MSFDNTQPPAPPAPTAAAPHPMPGAAAPAPSSQKNTLGLVALILAAAGILIGLIPLLGVVGWPLLTAAFVIAIVALAKKKKPTWMSIVALILSVVGPVILGIVGMVTAATVVGAALEESTGTSVEQPADDQAGEEAPAAEEPTEAAGSSRENPAAIGSVISGADWEIVINSVTLGATDAVLAASPINSAPEAGYEYILVNVTETYTGADTGMPALNTINYVTSDGVTIDGLDNIAIAPDALDSIAELYTDASATGNIVLAVPSATAADGVLVVTPGLLSDDVFVAVQ